VLSALGRAALASGDRAKAAEAFLRVYYEYPLTDAGTTAASQLGTLQDLITRTGYKADMGRAQQLFGARRYAEARSAFQELQRLAAGGDREIADLRVAESDFYLKRYAAARDATQPYLRRGSQQAEARFFHASALRELGDHDEFIAMTRALVKEFPDSPWAEEALNNLGTHYILENEDETAAAVFKELYDLYPSGSEAERAAWKYGWWNYKTENYAETIRVFESAAKTFPRSDYRPSWLYWAARSHGKLGNAGQLQARLRVVYTDYANSYYGRLAEKKLSQRAASAGVQNPLVPVKYDPVPPQPELSNEATIRLLLAAGLYDDALNELRYGQRLHGSSPAIDATIAWAYHKKGDLRRGITLMRRAYPQFLAAGQPLPVDILKVIFPLAYWDSIKRHATARGLDPFLVAALIAQESTFDPKARSGANAWGLMQIVPATGRRLARAVGMRRFSTSMLTNPDTNIRLGTLHFSRLVGQFGGTHFALASYNAGENRVVRWKAERPGIEQDEFIDDIPFPETQNYVKRILGTAEDYRMLYGKDGIAAPKTPAKKPRPRKR
jgi:soluble lytic murein transglycosylase